jgi:tetratricopeptide (TPR) repeat protein
MRTLFIAILLCFIFLANCQKKEEPPVQTSIPSVPLQAQNEIRFLQDAAKHDPNNVAIWINLGNVFMDNARYPEAIDAYEKALVLSPENTDVRVDMGTCYRRVGKYDRAVEEFRKAITIDACHPFAHRNLGVVLALDLHDKKQAIKEFEEYIRLSPDAADSNQIRQLVSKLKSESAR